MDTVARKVVADGGLAAEYPNVTHCLGHAIGMNMYEWPCLVTGKTEKLRAGVTCSDESGIYLRREFCGRLEEKIYITEDGAMWFTPQRQSIEQPFVR